MKFLAIREDYKTPGGQNIIGAAFANSVLVGKSAYQVAVDNGFVGTEAEWVAATDANRIASEASAQEAATSATNSASSATSAQASSVTAESARDASLLSKGVWPTTAAGIGQGVAGTSALVGGSGGTDGTFDLAFSGGTQVLAPKGRFVVESGAVTQVIIDYSGYYSAGSPTISFAASAGLTGASVSAVMGANTPVGGYFSVPSGKTDGYVDLYLVESGPVATFQKSGPSDIIVKALSDESYAQSKEFAMYSWIDDSVQAVINDGGALVVLESLRAESPIYRYEAGSILITDITMTIYPSYLECVIDSAGNARIIKAVDALRTGPVSFGETSGGFTQAPLYVAFLLCGQSNIGGRGAGGPMVEASTGYMWQDELLPIADPVGTETSPEDLGSAWPAFANKFRELTGLGVILIPAARGGTTLIDEADTAGFGSWGRGGTLRARAVDRYEAAAAALDASDIPWTFGGIIWGEGETVAARIDSGVVTQAEYDAGWRHESLVGGEPEGLYPYFQQKLGIDALPALIAYTGRIGAGNTAGCAAVRAVQQSWVREYPNVFCGFPSAVTFDARGLLNPDNLHINQEGLNQMGGTKAAVAAAHCVGIN